MGSPFDQLTGQAVEQGLYREVLIVAAARSKQEPIDFFSRASSA
jgi:hypothetical protein